MNYTRTLTIEDLKLLGSDPFGVLDTLINKELASRMSKLPTIKERIIGVMQPDEPMSAKTIMLAHNSKYPQKTIDRQRVAVILSNAYHDGQIKKHSRGYYYI